MAALTMGMFNEMFLVRYVVVFTSLGKISPQYLNRGKDPFIKISFEEACLLTAKVMIDATKTFSGDSGAKLLQEQGYDKAMIETMNKAGVQVLKFRGGMPLLGATRIMGFYRMANSMALLDDYIRKVGRKNALGGRGLRGNLHQRLYVWAQPAGTVARLADRPGLRSVFAGGNHHEGFF